MNHHIHILVEGETEEIFVRQLLIPHFEGMGIYEEINDDPMKAPSKRIAGIHDAYDKVYHGPRVAIRVGLPMLRHECRHFNDWLTLL